MLKKIISLFIILNSYALPQEFGMGLLLDDSLYANSPTAAPLMRGDYSDLPKSSSLKDKCPTPGYQGQYGTCAGWSTAFAGRTILEALKNNWDQATIDENAFSPSFVYNQIRLTSGCSGGTSLVDALDVIKDQGALKLDDFEYECEREVTPTDKKNAEEYRIIEYREIIEDNTPDKTKYVKKSIAEGRPVVIAFDCPPTFGYAGEVLEVDPSDYKEWGRGHGITVIGYDDDKFGGAFELINSWGTGWGNGGFTWIKYADFNYFCKYGFEMIDKSVPPPQTDDLSGSLQFTESNGDVMKAKFNGNYFKVEKPMPSGALFELRISNNEPAYVYAFSSDLTFKTYKIFPFDERMVAYLPYRQNNIAIPDEESFMMLDETPGRSYFCFLYSKESLEINKIMAEIEITDGNFWERINKVLGDKLVLKENIKYDSGEEISFRGRSEGKSIIPVLVEIDHR